jgi:hypothetical protein
MIRRAVLGLGCVVCLCSGSSLAHGDPCWSEDECLFVEYLPDEFDCALAPDYLDPHNDSRYNLALLYDVLTGQSPGEPLVLKEGELLPNEAEYRSAYAACKPVDPPGHYEPFLGEHYCRGNTYSAATAYLKALPEAKIAPDERRQLAQLRNRLLCANVDRQGQPREFQDLGSDLQALPKEGEVDALARYLRMAAEFYWGRYDDVIRDAAPLLDSSNDWVRQTAAIVQARAYMIRAQARWDGYSDRSTIDTADIKRSAGAYSAYVQRYPNGLYRRSAEGQIRRAEYLLGNDPAYRERFMMAWRAAQKAGLPREEFGGLVNEVDMTIPYLAVAIADGKLVGAVTDDVLLFAAGIMAFFRSPDLVRQDDARVLRREIKRHADLLKPIPGLQGYLLTLDASAREDWNGVIDSSRTREKGEAAMVTLSKAVLRAKAFERKKSWDEALTAWKDVIAGSDGHNAWQRWNRRGDVKRAQAGYVRSAMLAGRPEAFLFSGSPIPEDAPVGSYAVRHFLTLEQLRMAAGDARVSSSLRRSAAQTLLLRLALAQQWSSFVTAYGAAAPADRVPFVALETAARTLSDRPEDPKALLNAGYYFVEQVALREALDLCPSETSLDADLGPIPPSTDYPRPITYFMRAIDQHPGGDLEAQLLYHAIKCFSGRWDQACASGDVPKSTREAWFTTLKTRYRQTQWARKTKYWW